MDTTAHLETEVKFNVPCLEKIKYNIIDLGGISQGKTFELNIRYDDPRERLRSEGRLLRLRKDKAARLTFKRRPSKFNPEFKSYLEYEVVVDDFETMGAILNQLGFRPVQRYEKIREAFIIDQCTVCLDQMPFGNFIEIEGREINITRMARKLGLDWNCRILANYLAIFEKLRQKAALEFNDVTFDNFKNNPVDQALILHEIESLQADKPGTDHGGDTL